MSNGISGVGGFGTYTIFNSALQYLLGIGRRNSAEEQQRINENFELKMVEAKERFSDEMEAAKLAMTRAKMQVARRYRAIEAQDRLCLSQKRPQLIKFLKEDLPIDPTLLKSLNIEAEKNRELESKGLVAPINVLLFFPISEVDKPLINASLEENFKEYGDIRLLPWTTKLASGNASLLNLNVIMRDMPTLAISPRYVEGEKKLYLSAALWDSNSERHPYIRPLFKVDFDVALLQPREGEKGINKDGKKELSEKIILAATIVAGSARDSYMLMSYGQAPMLPYVIKNNKWLKEKLLSPEFDAIKQFVINEYESTIKLLSSQNVGEKGDSESIKELSRLAESSLFDIQSIVSRQITR